MRGYVSDDQIGEFTSAVRSHIGTQEQAGILPSASDAILGEFGRSEAEQWIKDYTDALKGLD